MSPLYSPHSKGNTGARSQIPGSDEYHHPFAGCSQPLGCRAQGPIDLRYDAGVYYLTGEALGSGFGYRLISEPGNINAIQYPPLLPSLVALVRLATNSSDPEIVGRVLRLLYFVFSIAYTLSSYALARTFVTPCWALFAAAVPTLHVHTVFMSDFCSQSFLIPCSQYYSSSQENSDAGQREFGPRFWVSAILAPAAFFLRTSGLALLAPGDRQQPASVLATCCCRRPNIAPECRWVAGLRMGD